VRTTHRYRSIFYPERDKYSQDGPIVELLTARRSYAEFRSAEARAILMDYSERLDAFELYSVMN
jgi:hypothetical protein